jgi:hypothetical protein
MFIRACVRVHNQISRAEHPILFSVSDTRSSDTSTPVFDTDTPILFKIPGSDTRYSDTSDTLQKHKKSFSWGKKANPPLPSASIYVLYIRVGWYWNWDKSTPEVCYLPFKSNVNKQKKLFWHSDRFIIGQTILGHAVYRGPKLGCGLCWLHVSVANLFLKFLPLEKNSAPNKSYL